MLVVPGSKTFARLPNNGGVQAVKFSLPRLDAANGKPAGTWDPDVNSPYYGTFLHIRAVLGECSDSMVTPVDPDRRPTLQEWDPEGVEIFPRDCAQVELVGGAGLYGTNVVMVPSLRRFYQPRERRLLRFLPPDGPGFKVPDGHTKIGCLNNTVPVINQSDGGAPLILMSGDSQPIISGTLITNPNSFGVMVWTSFVA